MAKLVGILGVALLGAAASAGTAGQAFAAARPVKAAGVAPTVTALTLSRSLLPAAGGGSVLRLRVQGAQECWVTAAKDVTVLRDHRGCRDGVFATVVHLAAADVTHLGTWRIVAHAESATATVARIVVLKESALESLSVATTGLGSMSVGLGYVGELSASGGTPPYHFAVTSGSLPAGVALAADGEVSGTPTVAGSASATVEVTDSSKPDPLVASTTISLAVSPPPLSISAPTLPEGTANLSYFAALTANGGTAPYTWSVGSGELPPGIELASNGSLSGTPTTPGTYSAVLEVADSSPTTQTSSQSVTIIVLPAVLAITDDILPEATVGSAYSEFLVATGGTTPYNWTVAAGSLPAGLSLASDGLVSGTPTLAGTVELTVEVADSSQPEETTTATITIDVTTPALSINDSALPEATVGVSYSYQLSASGGTTPYTWTIVSGSLPSGMNFSTSGQLSGTPGSNTQGSYQITVEVKDSSSPTQVSENTFTLNVVS